MRPRPFEIGDFVQIAAAVGTVVGEVVDARAVEDMPDLGSEALSKEAFGVMREWQVDFAALIMFWDGKQDVSFFALRHPGGWRDLHGQDLQLTKVAGPCGEGAA